MESHTSTSRTLIALALYVGVGVRLAHGAPGDIYNLGTLFEGTHSEAFKINDAGQVIGVSQVHVGGSYGIGPFRYDGIPGSGGAMLDLNALTHTFDGIHEINGAHGINNGGQMAGSTYVPVPGDDPVGGGFRYTGTPGAGGVMEVLGPHITPHSINDAGQIAGIYTTDGGYGRTFAIRYTGSPGAGGVMENLGTVPGGFQSVAYAINNAGQIAGLSSTVGDDEYHAFLYTGTPGAGGAMADLGTLGSGTNSSAEAINNSGQVTGYSDLIPDPNLSDDIGPPSHAFLYSGTPGAGGAMVDLGTLGGPHSIGYGINDAGFVVGGAMRPEGDNGWATLWLTDSAHTAIDLDVWLDATNPTMGAYWIVGSAYDINNNGLITGTGCYDDGPGGLDDGMRGIILDASNLVPEPASLVLLALGLTLLVWHKVRQSIFREGVGLNQTQR